jgi:hypothetical protein
MLGSLHAFVLRTAFVPSIHIAFPGKSRSDATHMGQSPDSPKDERNLTVRFPSGHTAIIFVLSLAEAGPTALSLEFLRE